MDFEPNFFAHSFFKTKPNAWSLLNLFEALPNAYFYAKNSDSRFTYVNRNMLGIYNLRRLEDLIGKTDRDFHPPALAEAYIAEDGRVMKDKAPILNQLWLVPHVLGTPKWYVSSKVPLWSSPGKVAGIAGVMHLVDTPHEQAMHFGVLKPAIQYLDRNFRERISMESMAELSGMSSSLFNQRFKSLLRLTPPAFQILASAHSHSIHPFSSNPRSDAPLGPVHQASGRDRLRSRLLRPEPLLPKIQGDHRTVAPPVPEGVSVNHLKADIRGAALARTKAAVPEANSPL